MRVVSRHGDTNGLFSFYRLVDFPAIVPPAGTCLYYLLEIIFIPAYLYRV